MIEDPYFTTFWGHLEELRNALVKAVAVVAIAFVCCLPFAGTLFGFFTQALHTPEQIPSSPFTRSPMHQEAIRNIGGPTRFYIPASDEKVIGFTEGVQNKGARGWEIPSQGILKVEKITTHETLVILHPMEGITATLKICFWIALVATSPVWLFFIFRFFLPALNYQERALALPFLISSLLFFSAGIGFAYFFTLPIALTYLQYFNEGLGANLWGVTNTIDFMLFVFFSNGLAFEMCVILFFLIHLGVLSADTLILYRRHAIVGIFVISAILTPPDVITQLLLAIPLSLVYEIAIIYAQIRLKTVKIIY